VRLRVLRAIAIPAVTPTGRQRQRMRVSVTLKARNTSGSPLRPGTGGRRIYLAVLGRQIAPDVNARRLPGAFSLAQALRPGAERSGELRFETAGAATRTIVRDRGAQLGVRVAKDRIGVVRLRFPNLG
jgi:hypothetical protein